jgi:hypothetical protein
MGIATAVQRGTFVLAFDDDGRMLCSIPVGMRPGDGLKGFTSSAISIQCSNRIHVFDQSGREIGNMAVAR